MQNIYQLLLDKISQNHSLIEDWFAEKFAQNPPLFYNSVDLRHSHFKIAAIDTNCFPAGFNNLSSSSKIKAQQLIKDFFTANNLNPKKILIIPENHTTNIKYLENILALQSILSDQQKEVVIGSLIEDIDDQLIIDLENNQKIILHKLICKGDFLATKNGFIPDLIIINNDFTNPPAALFSNLAQKIIPSISLGWYQRRKSHHFSIYNQLAAELCALLKIDPWLISTIYYDCQDVDFKARKGISCLSKNIDKLIAQIKEKYRQYNIDNEPYCYIKSDNGTYGMAMMTVKSGAEIIELNKKDRNKMNMLKGSVQNTSVIIQEGIPTYDRIKNIIAEPMIYLIGGRVAGNLFRANSQRDIMNNLNSAGMSFYDLSDLNDSDLTLGLQKTQIEIVYILIARLAALAAAQEINNQKEIMYNI